jgi:hypothetical protein
LRIESRKSLLFQGWSIGPLLRAGCQHRGEPRCVRTWVKSTRVDKNLPGCSRTSARRPSPSFLSHNFLDAPRLLAVRQPSSSPAPVKVPSWRSEDVSHLSSPLDSQQLRPPGCPIFGLSRRSSG